MDSDDLIDAMERIRANKQKNVLGTELKHLFEEWKESEDKRLALPMAGKIVYIDRNDILFCKSDGNYTEVYFENGSKKVFSKRLKEFEDILGHGFFRVHNSYVTRLGAIKEFVNQDGQYLILKNGTNVPVSRSKKSELLKILNG